MLEYRFNIEEVKFSYNYFFIGGCQAKKRGGYVVLHRGPQRNAAECKLHIASSYVRNTS